MSDDYAVSKGFRAFLTRQGRRGLRICEYAGGMGLMFREALWYIFIAPFRGTEIRRSETFKQCVRVGVASVPIVSVVLLFVGMILALQMAYVLKMFGVLQYVASVVSVAIIRELGPLLTAVVLTGYAGASIAAELGSMKVNEEILALETSAMKPVRFLVVPRILALMIMTPCLTVLADAVGIFGGFVVGTLLMDISPELYWQKTISNLEYKDLYTGLVKSEVFGIILGMVACFEGFSVEGGAEGVGRATTNSVVLAIVLVVTADLFFTTLFYFILGGG